MYSEKFEEEEERVFVSRSLDTGRRDEMCAQEVTGDHEGHVKSTSTGLWESVGRKNFPLTEDSGIDLLRHKMRGVDQMGCKRTKFRFL